MITTTKNTVTVTKYRLIDRRTGALVASYATRAAARRARDRKDNAYGAYRYSVETLVLTAPRRDGLFAQALYPQVG